MKQFLRRKCQFLWPVFLAVCLLLALNPFTAIAQGPGEQLVVDNANVLGNRTGEVEAAANRLVSSGADVRVWVIQTYGDAGNLDRYEASLELQYPSWTDSTGNRKNNLIALLVAVSEQQTGLYYGSQWESALGSRWTQIQTNTLNPRFAQGDFAGGLIAGLDEITRLIQGQASGQPQSGGGLSTGLIVFLVITFIAALIIGLAFYLNSRRSREKRLAARQKALLAKQAAASKVNSLVDALQMLDIKVNATAAKVSPEDAAPLLASLGKAKILVDQGAQQYSELSHSAGDPENPKLGEAQLTVIAGEYQKVLETLHEADNEVGRVEAGVDTLQQAISSFNDKAAGIEAAIEETSRKMGAAQVQGFRIDHPAGLLDQARQSLAAATSQAQDRQYLQASQKISAAGELTTQAAQYTEAIPQKKQETAAAIQALASRVDRVKETILKGRESFDRISSTYAESSWESIQGNGSEAENRVDWALDALKDARTASSMENQDWSRAQELVRQGNAWMDEAESFMHSIFALKTSLEEARKDSSGEINAAQTDISSAWKYINAYDEDIRESLEDDLREAERKLTAATAQLHQEKADYLLTVKLAREANESADKILAQARTEHETAQRLRSKAVSALRDARSRISIAGEYIQDHRSDAGDEAGNYLNNAVNTLHQAETSPDLNTRISLAEQAENTAASAYSLARQRVNNAWERRPGLPPIIVLPGGGYSNRGPSWGSRRSSPFGSGGSRPGGGGSTGWGAGRGGGGGSTHW